MNSKYRQDSQFKENKRRDDRREDKRHESESYNLVRKDRNKRRKSKSRSSITSKSLSNQRAEKKYKEKQYKNEKKNTRRSPEKSPERASRNIKPDKSEVNINKPLVQVQEPEKVKIQPITKVEQVDPVTEIATKKPQFNDVVNSRAGGVYIPPFKLALMYEQIREKNEKSSVDYQKMMWEMLRKSINGIINKVNLSNIQNVIYELFNENLLRGKGLLARAIIKAQMASPNFTHVYACLVAVLNTKLPDIARLIIERYVIQFQKAYKRNNKIVCMAASKMLAHLVNQQVVHEILALEILALFLESPTEDSVEMACDFMTECGQVLGDIYPPGVHSIFERFRGILHEGTIDKRTQYTIENLFAIRKTDFKDHVGVLPELDLVADEDKIIHDVYLDDKLDCKLLFNI